MKLLDLPHEVKRAALTGAQPRPRACERSSRSITGRGHHRTKGAVMAEALLKIMEVAKRLRVGDDWVYERINRGEIPVVDLGDTRKNQRIRESDLDSFITARTYGA